MKILIVGHGGREHALLDCLRRDRPDARFFITIGNAGTVQLAESVPIAPSDIDALATWAAGSAVDLTIVGPEAPLAGGMVDVFAARGLAAFGPTRDATAIESSKAWAKRLMAEAGVPTAAFAAFTTIGAALEFIDAHDAPLVVKASGLAAGKGVIIALTREDAKAAARDMLSGHSFGAAGRAIVIEQFLTGEELSVFALTDGTDAILMLPAQDHKRIGEGDTGPNTGGMGAYAPVSIANTAVIDQIRTDIVEPTIAALREAGSPFRGLLYCGLMLTDGRPVVIEFNARFGDPETQALLPLLDAPLLDIMMTIARGGSIAGGTLAWKHAAALTTVLASAGYPESSTTGVPVHIPREVAEADGLFIYHAGSRIQDGQLVTDGGRVLAVTAIADSLEKAARCSRDAVARIAFDGRQYRRDIGWRELQRHARTA